MDAGGLRAHEPFLDLDFVSQNFEPDPMAISQNPTARAGSPFRAQAAGTFLTTCSATTTTDSAV